MTETGPREPGLFAVEADRDGEMDLTCLWRGCWARMSLRTNGSGLDDLMASAAEHEAKYHPEPQP